MVHRNSLASVRDIHRRDDFYFELQLLGVRRSRIAVGRVRLNLNILDAHVGERVLEV